MNSQLETTNDGCSIFQSVFGGCPLQMLVKILFFKVFFNLKKEHKEGKIMQKRVFEFAPFAGGESGNFLFSQNIVKIY